ncbi:MAG: DUF805 domain-containing protein [Oscillospiraceae bacterium]|nr:DUF805 domain-containing protein [Oscillospiraceae bacterium]
MGFKEAINQAFHKFGDITGRARRSEFWYFSLFVWLVNFAFGIVIEAAGGYNSGGGRIFGALSGMASIALLIPSITLGVRRLHDIGKSGWNYLVILIPFVGWILLLIWFCRDSQQGDNQYGSNPKGSVGAGAGPGGTVSNITYGNTNKVSVSSAAPKQPAAPPGEKRYYERDNMGTRQENMSQAMSYWMVERMGKAEKPPFTLFTMPSAKAAEEALLELPFIHKAADSGKLICERLMTFGYYETTENGVLTGKYEALVTGSDLTLDEFKLAEDAFTRRGGTCKNHEAPSAAVKAQTTQGDAKKVRHKETVRGNDGISTYEVYTAPDKASAMAYLKTRTVSQRLYYIVVETPEGNFGRDINGFYQE